MTVVEVVMKPEQTALLATAKARGCRLHLGRRMLDAQVRLLADFLGACGEESGKVGGQQVAPQRRENQMQVGRKP